MTIVNKPVNQDEVNRLLYDILFDMQHFGEFGARKNYLAEQVDKLDKVIREKSVCDCCGAEVKK